MQARVPPAILQILRDSGKPSPWKCKLHLRKGRTVFGVTIAETGDIISVEGRRIYAQSDITFSPSIIVDVTVY